VVERKFTERAVGRRAVGRLITTSGLWSTIYNLVDSNYALFCYLVYSRPNATSSNKSTKCHQCQIVEYKDIV